MDEEISIINSKARSEKIKNFFIKNKKILIFILTILILIPISFSSYQIYSAGHKKGLAEKYNLAVINYESGNKSKVLTEMKMIINEKDKTYSPLALYFLIDNELITSTDETNEFFDILIKETNLDNEIRNLIIYKKGLFNANFETENNLIKILNPVIKSESVWKSHALYLMAEYFFENNQKQKAKEFYSQILNYNKSNEKILIETRKRLNRDFSD